MLTLPRQTEVLAQSVLKDHFEHAITATYPQNHHLYEHGDIATASLHCLWETKERLGYENIKVVPRYTEKPQLTYAFQLNENVSTTVTVPILEALSWLYLQDQLYPDQIMSLIPTKYPELNRWAITMSAYQLAYGNTNVTRPKIKEFKKFEFTEYLNSINLPSEKYFDRIKRRYRTQIEFIMSQQFNIQLLPKIETTITGLPTAIIDYNRVQNPPFFSTAFMDNEYFPNLRKDIIKRIQ